MLVDCPYCGRKGRLPEDVAIPATVRCPDCRNKFQPVAVTEPIIVADPVPSKQANLTRTLAILAIPAYFATFLLGFLAGRLTASGHSTGAAVLSEIVGGPVAGAMAVADGLKVRVVKAEIGPYASKSPFGTIDHDEDEFVIHIEIANTSRSLKYDSGGWPSGQLTDEFGNRYRLLTDNHVGRPDRIPSMLRPGEVLKDVLVFQPPLSQAKTLTLDYQPYFTTESGPPQPGSISLEIPALSIVRKK